MTETSEHPVSVMPPPIAEKSTPTVESLTVEIKFYLGQMTQNIIEVGKRLIQAKELIPHGQWGGWLETNFNLKVRMAQNFMAIANRFDNSSNSQNTQTFAYLGSSQLIAMLALPEGDEQQFIDQMAANGTPIEEMSVRQLQAKIKQYKQDLTNAQDEGKNWRESFDRSQDEIASWKETVANLESRIEYQEEVAAKAQANYEKADKKNGLLLEENANLQESLDIANADIAKLTGQLENGKTRTVIKEVPPADYADLQREVKELRERPVEVATEYPKDYEPMKEELAELKERESSFKQTYVAIRKLDALSSALAAVLNETLLQDAINYWATENPAPLNLLSSQISVFYTEFKNYVAIAQTKNKPAETTETVISFPVAVNKTLSRAEILHELKQLAADDKTKQTSAKMQEIAREIGVPKSDDMTDEQLLTVLKKIKEWKATNEN